MTIIELSSALDKPAVDWRYEENLDGGARSYAATFVERNKVTLSDVVAPQFMGGGQFFGGGVLLYGGGSAQTQKIVYRIEESIVNAAKVGDAVRVFVDMGLGEEELIEGTIDSYETDDNEENVPIFTVEGRDTLKAKLNDFFPTTPFTYQGREVNSDGTLGTFFWKFQQIVTDICTKAGVTRVKFLCPDFILGNDLVWSVNMSAADAINWLLENGGMRVTEKHAVDVFPIREPVGWTLYFVKRGFFGSTITLPYGTAKVRRKLRRTLPESRKWTTVQVLGMTYQVGVLDIVTTAQPIQGHPWQSGFTTNEPPLIVIDARGFEIRRKDPITIFHFQDGRVSREEWTDLRNTFNSAGTLTGTRVETGEVSYDYDLQTRRLTKQRTVVTLAGFGTILDRSETWTYGQVLSEEGTVVDVVKRHVVTENTADETTPASELLLTLEEVTEVVRVSQQLFKRYTRRLLDRTTGQTTFEGRTTELAAGDTLPPQALILPGLRLEERELKSGLDTAFKKFKFPAIGEQAWLDQVLADINDEKLFWKIEGSYDIVPDPKAVSGTNLVWIGAPARWKTTQFLISRRHAQRVGEKLTESISVLAWEVV